MAIVDFSHATIEPVGTSSQTGQTFLSLKNQQFKDVNGTVINSGGSYTTMKEEQRLVMYQYNGTFIASGTEFYVGMITSSGILKSAWKVSNVSFSSGDTYVFQIRASLICN